MGGSAKTQALNQFGSKLNWLLPKSRIGHSACGSGFSAVADKE
jgi:hypothetical protein